jgi:hypothetical protein
MERRTRAQWSALVDELEASGQSRATFCRRRGIEVGTLKWWMWKLGRGGRGARHEARAIRLVPVDVVESGGTADADGGAEVVIEVAGVTVRIATGTSPEYVAKLIAALRAPC